MKNNRRRPPRGIPTPDEIADAPEIALLHALDEILELVPRTLVAAHPELGDPEAPFWARETSRCVRKAADIVANTHRLQRHLRAYRATITRARDRRLEADPKIPF